MFDVLEKHIGLFYVRCLAKNKITCVISNIVSVHGVVHTVDKESFLVDTVHVLGSNKFHFAIGGGSNIIRKIDESNKRIKLSNWSVLLNVVFNSELRVIELTRRIYTWSNKHEYHVFKNLDKVLVSTSWGEMSPRVSIFN